MSFPKISNSSLSGENIYFKKMKLTKEAYQKALVYKYSLENSHYSFGGSYINPHFFIYHNCLFYTDCISQAQLLMSLPEVFSLFVYIYYL